MVQSQDRAGSDSPASACWEPSPATRWKGGLLQLAFLKAFNACKVGMPSKSVEHVKNKHAWI